MTYRAMRDTWRSFRSPVVSPMGFLFVGNEQMQSGNFEPSETHLANVLLDESDVLINVGANIGYYVCVALRKNVSVVAFEPDRFNVNYLLRNIEMNGWSEGIEIFPIAASDHIGIAHLYGGGTGASIVAGYSDTDISYSSLSPCNSLDNLLSDRLYGKRLLVIIDVEGSELSVLRGSKKLLESYPSPVFIVEIAVYENQPSGISLNPNLLETFELFWQLGYQCWTVEEQYQPISRERIEAVIDGEPMQTTARNFLFAKGDHVFKSDCGPYTSAVVAND